MRKGRPIPGINSDPWWKKKWVVEFVAASVALLLLMVTAVRSVKDGTDDLIMWIIYSILGILTVGAGFLRTAHSYAEDAKKERGAEHDGLLGTMVTFHALVSDIINRERPAEDRADLRVTFHTLAPNPKEPTHLEQVIPYVTDDGIHGNVGRRFSANVGITGEAIRTREPCLLASEASSDEEHMDILIQHWGYLPWQAKLLTPRRFSAIAAPVLVNTRRSWRHSTNGEVAQMVIGVIYLDSSSRDAFDDDITQEQLMVLFDAVADYVTWRY